MNRQGTMPSESTPLLDSETQQQSLPVVPLPTAQLFALWVSRLTDPISYTQIFPYINQFLLVLHVTDDVSKVGLYSGLVESTFAVTQTLTSYSWARLSDSIGRRPIIMFGASGLAVVTLLLGFCRSLAQIIAVRAIAGFLAGNLAVFHAILAEIWPLGAVIGPLIGGQLSNLGTKFPDTWGFDFILRYPYFMPNLVCTVLVLFGLLLAYLFLEETLPAKRRGASGNQVFDTQSSAYGVRDLLADPKMRSITISSFTLGFIGAAFDVVFVLFCYTPIQRGGLSFSPLALNGFILAVFQLFLMPILLRRVKAANPIFLWFGIAIVLMCSRIAALAYGTSCLGAANGLVQVAMGGSRCFSPAFISSVFAISIDNNALGGYPIWVVVMLCVCMVGCYFSEKMVEMNEPEKEGI
ncbi:major facilitator superfamily domain-containing protein [Mycena amicta]|nr:major facilitator superfamily domain-containing protein [Mycena amicta]